MLISAISEFLSILSSINLIISGSSESIKEKLKLSNHWGVKVLSKVFVLFLIISSL